MAKTLLRSGCLDDFQAIGDNGQAVFDSALQIRETLRLRGQPIVNCLAVPQPNDHGDYLDWYAPLAGKVVSFAAASEAQRQAALRYLDDALQQASTLSEQCQHSAKTAVQLFGRLLEKALHFPGVHHLYVVGDQPVVTFWGFIGINQSPADDDTRLTGLRRMLESLESSTPPTSPEAPCFPPATSLPDVSPPQSREQQHAAAVNAAYQAHAHADEQTTADLPDNDVHLTLHQPLAAGQPPQPHADQPAFNAAEARLRAGKRLALCLAVIFLVIAALAAVTYWQYPTPSPQPPAAPLPAAIAPSPTPPSPTAPPARPALLQPDAALPLAAARQTAATAPVIVPAPSPAADLLQMDASQVRDGKTQFLNGSWRIDFITPATASGDTPAVPPLHYDIKNNKGYARVQPEGNRGRTCKAEIYSGLHASGILMIKPRGRVRCSDNSLYTLPEIACKTGNNMVTQCLAHYTKGAPASVASANASAVSSADLPVTIRKARE